MRLGRRSPLDGIADMPRPEQINIADGSPTLVRAWRWADISQLVTLVERRRDEYQVLAPIFWKKSEKSAIWTSCYYRFLLLTRRATALVAEEDRTIVGFLLAMRARVPPVFDPGPTIFVDDFYVVSPDRWDDLGRVLIGSLCDIGKERGWRQMIVVSGTADEPKNAFLNLMGLSETSSWWTGAF